MNNRERSWYEGKYGQHPTTCNCYMCHEAKRRKEKEEEDIAREQARMREGAEERVAEIERKKSLI